MRGSTIRRSWTWFALTAVLFCARVSAGQQTENQTVVAVLLKVEGRVEIQSPAQKPRILRPRRDELTPLRAGDRLRCLTPSAAAVISLNGRERPVEQCSKGYTVPPTQFALALREYGRTGGLPRNAFSGFVLWPVEGVRARPQTASHVQWRAQTKGVLTLTLRGGSPARVLWTRADVDAATGGFHDTELESALRAAAARGDLMPVLELRSTSGQPATVTISLISGPEDQQVQDRMTRAVAGASGPIANLLRADVLLQAGLQREALDEYLGALETNPEAAFLLEKAAALAGALGDPRAADLRDRAEAAARPS